MLWTAALAVAADLAAATRFADCRAAGPPCAMELTTACATGDQNACAANGLLTCDVQPTGDDCRSWLAALEGACLTRGERCDLARNAPLLVPVERTPEAQWALDTQACVLGGDVAACSLVLWSLEDHLREAAPDLELLRIADAWCALGDRAGCVAAGSWRIRAGTEVAEGRRLLAEAASRESVDAARELLMIRFGPAVPLLRRLAIAQCRTGRLRACAAAVRGLG